MYACMHGTLGDERADSRSTDPHSYVAHAHQPHTRMHMHAPTHVCVYVHTHRYLKTWFPIDLVSSIPFDEIIGTRAITIYAITIYAMTI